MPIERAVVGDVTIRLVVYRADRPDRCQHDPAGHDHGRAIGRAYEMSEPELLLLSVDHQAIRRLYNRVLRGEESALAEFLSIWDPYWDRDLECFACGSEVEERPVFSLAIPDARDGSRAILLPLCAECAGLPEQLRWHRVSKVIKAVWSVRLAFMPTR